VQEHGDGAFLVELLAFGEIERVDAGQAMVRRVAHQTLEGRHGVGVGGLAQDREQGVGVAHGGELCPNQRPARAAPDQMI
jgi:hypothetical protein